MPSYIPNKCYVVFGGTGIDSSSAIWIVASFTSEPVAKEFIGRLEKTTRELALDEESTHGPDPRIVALNQQFGMYVANRSDGGLRFWYDECILNPFKEKLS